MSTGPPTTELELWANLAPGNVGNLATFLSDFLDFLDLATLFHLSVSRLRNRAFAKLLLADLKRLHQLYFSI